MAQRRHTAGRIAGGVAALLLALGSSSLHAVEPPRDWRNIVTGTEIPSQNYADQPYVTVLPDGVWLCVLTTGAGQEGAEGQLIQSTRSEDQGRTWSAPVAIEEPGGPDASWAMPLLTDFGRVYVFYDYNGDHFGEAGNPYSAAVPGIRTDMLGWYCYRYSDDGGRSWSAQRYRLPVRVTDADRRNTFAGKVQLMWGVGKPIRHDGVALFSFTKMQRYMMSESEGWLFRSRNVLVERDPEKVEWEMLPAGEHPIRSASLGPIQSEHNLASLPQGRVACMYRTVLGSPAIAYSADGGVTWSEPTPARYSPAGRTFKHPRACPRIWRCTNGKYLFWFHNHDGKHFEGRNPAWAVGGVAKEGVLHWSEPEILLYSPQPLERMSYPDLVEQEGRYWFTETQKSVARVHEADPALLEGMWAQVEDRLPRRPVDAGLAGEFFADELSAGDPPRLAEAVHLRPEGGFTVELWATIDCYVPGQVLIDARGRDRRGWSVVAGMSRQLALQLKDGADTAKQDVDPFLLEEKTLHHVAFVVDAGPNIITAIVDGQLCDGGPYRQYGWGWFDPDLADLGRAPIAVDRQCMTIRRLRIYNRALRTAEVVQNYRAGCDVPPVPRLTEH